MNAPIQKPRAAAPSNTREMRSFLVERMMDVAEGRVNAEKAKSICNISQQVYNTLNVEIKMAVAKAKLNGGEVEAVDFNG